MRLFLSLAAVALLAVSELQAACGVERWSVKTGTDSQASSVNLSTYILDDLQLPPIDPAGLSTVERTRFAP